MPQSVVTYNVSLVLFNHFWQEDFEGPEMAECVYREGSVDRRQPK